MPQYRVYVGKNPEEYTIISRYYPLRTLASSQTVYIIVANRCTIHSKSHLNCVRSFDIPRKKINVLVSLLIPCIGKESPAVYLKLQCIVT